MPTAGRAIVGRVRRTGQKLLKFDRRLGARFVAGTDEAGRGSLAGPLVVAGVLLDYACLREHRVRPLTYLNDSKQVPPDQRDELYRGVVGCAERIVVRVVPADEIDRRGLHRSNLDAMRAILHTLTPPAEACLVDGFRLGPSAPEHTSGRRRRHEERGDRRRVDRRQGHPRPPDAADGLALSAVRLLLARRLHHADALDGSCSRTGRRPIHRRSWRATVLCGTRASAERVGTTACAATASSARTSGRRLRARPGRPPRPQPRLLRGEGQVRDRLRRSARDGHEREGAARAACGGHVARGEPGARRLCDSIRRRRRARHASWSASRRRSDGNVEAVGAVAPTQDALYAEIDLELSWSERDLPERERTKHVHRLHPVPRQVHPAARRDASRPVPDTAAVTCSTRSPARARHSCRRSSRASTRPASTSPRSTACSCASRRSATTSSSSSASCVTPSGRLDSSKTKRGRLATCASGSRRRPRASCSSFSERIDDYEHHDVLRVILARAARSARRTTHFDLDFPRAPQLEPYWCHKHKRECRPVESAKPFLRRYTLDTLARIKAFAKAARERPRGDRAPRGLARARLRPLVRRPRHVAAVLRA